MIPELKKPYFLAGGIHLGNIRQAAAHGPYCIDVSSAVETGGRKDRRKMEEIAQVLR
jgi:phosphoribosylanthranilate isomerase